MPPRGTRTKTPTDDHRMQTIAQASVLVAAIQFSMIYKLLEGRVIRGIVVYFVATMLGK
jgi:hypothetical protein